MSILIKAVDMPTSCPLCPCSDDESRYCRAVNKYIPMLGHPKFCPLVYISPHGRLIDADAPITVREESEWGIPVNVKTTVSKFLLGHIIGEIPPTIIEAEVDDG